MLKITLPISLLCIALASSVGCELRFSIGTDRLAPQAPAIADAVVIGRSTAQLDLVVPADDGDGVEAFKLELHASESGPLIDVQVHPVSASVGEQQSVILNNLRPGRGEYVAISAIDYAGNQSKSVWVGPFENDFNYSGAVFPLEAEAGDNALGYQFANSDFDGDGFSDVAVAAPFKQTMAGNGAGSVYIYRGSRDGLETKPSLVIDGNQKLAQFGNALTVIDWNNNGTLDLAVGAPFANDGDGAVYIFAGENIAEQLTIDSSSIRHFAGAADAEVRSDGQGWFEQAAFGFTLSPLDHDGDGRNELAVSAIAGGSSDDGNGGIVVLFADHGGSALLSEHSITSLALDPEIAVSARVLTAPNSAPLFGITTVVLPDSQALAVASYGGNRIAVFAQGPTPALGQVSYHRLDMALDTELVSSLPPEALLGSSLGTISFPQASRGSGDQLIVGAYLANNGKGVVAIVPVVGPGFYPLEETANALILGEAGQQLGSASTRVNGDVDGDGIADLAIVGGRGKLELNIWYGDALPSGRLSSSSAAYHLSSPTGMIGEIPSIGGTPASIAWVGDTDGDELDDLVWADWASNQRDGLFELLR